MNRNKLTRWFPPEIKPVRSGVYEVKNRFGKSGVFAHFDGIKWSGYNSSILGAIENRDLQKLNNDIIATIQEKKWRGLTEQAYFKNTVGELI